MSLSIKNPYNLYTKSVSDLGKNKKNIKPFFLFSNIFQLTCVHLAQLQWYLD